MIWRTLLSCGPVLHNLFNPTLPRRKHFYFPNKHYPHPIPKRRRRRRRKQTFKHLRTKSSKTNRTITDLRFQVTHLISSHDYDCYRAWNSFFLTPLSNLHGFSKLFWCCCKAAIHGHEDPAIPRAPRAPKGFHLKLCRPPNRALQAHPADSAGDPSSDTEATDDVSAPCNKLAEVVAMQGPLQVPQDCNDQYVCIGLIG